MSDEEPPEEDQSRRSLPKRSAAKQKDETSDSGEIINKKRRHEGRKNVSSTSETEGKERSKHRQSYCWIDHGTENPNRTVDYSELEVTKVDGTTYRVSPRDTVLLLSDNNSLTRMGEEDNNTSHEAFIARVERMWETNATTKKKRRRSPDMKMRVRWYFKKRDVENLGGDLIGIQSTKELLDGMGSKDLILSNQHDDNDICTIIGKCQVIHRRPSSEPIPPDLPEGTFVSSYSISFGQTPGNATLAAHDGPNDDWPDAGGSPDNSEFQALENNGAITSAAESTPKTLTRSKRRFVSQPPSAPSSKGGSTGDGESQEGSSGSSSSDESSDEGSISSRERGPVTEGSTTIGNIKVGPEYQVAVPTFSGQKIAQSRKPVLLWKPTTSLSQQDYDEYLVRAAETLFDFLKANGLLAEEAYKPLAPRQLDIMTGHESRHPTLSDISTGASLIRINTGRKLTRECNVDAILSLLHEKDYDTERALDAIKASPSDYLTIWTDAEKELFDHGFRQYSGSLRMIRKGLAPSKEFKDVVDYHYRFKVPDQFRRYQSKKREQAVRMMECIEKRRYHDSIDPQRETFGGRKAGSDGARYDGASSEAADWARTGAADVIGSVEERCVAAKNLLLDVRAKLGADKFSEVANAVKACHKKPTIELKEKLVDLLRERPVLLERLLKFLPKRIRD